MWTRVRCLATLRRYCGSGAQHQGTDLRSLLSAFYALGPCPSSRVEEGRGGLGHVASLRFPSPLIEPDVRICRVDQPLLAFTPTDPIVRRYRNGLYWKVTCVHGDAPCQD